jgi:anti-anti-sigma factor
VTASPNAPGVGVVAGVSLTVQIIHDRQQARLLPIGELDVYSVRTFTVAGDLAIDERPAELHIDLTQISFIDSSGVRGVEDLVARASRLGVACRVIDRVGPRDPEISTKPIVIWSGSTTRSVERPEDQLPGSAVDER